MLVQWTETAIRRFQRIKSDHFSDQETVQYKLDLILRVEEQVIKMRTIMPSREFKDTYYCIVDRYIVSYKVLDRGERYIITSFTHGAMKRNFKSSL